jgi:hypothetical protein
MGKNITAQAPLFVHGSKNKLAVSKLNQYTNGNHLRLPMNPIQPRKGKKDETVRCQRQFAVAPF